MSKTQVWAVVPLKTRGCAKQRLSSALTPMDRRALVEAMARDVISTLVACDAIDGVIVVTRDELGEELRWDYGVTLLREPEQAGLNGAIRFASEFLESKQVGAMLVVPGDLPLLSGDDLTDILTGHCHERGLTLVPAWGEGGTNCFLASPPTIIAPAFGEDSFRRHMSGARQAGLSARVLTLPHVGLDIDRPADIDTFLKLAAATPSGVRTRGLLAQGLTQGCASEPVNSHTALMTGELA